MDKRKYILSPCGTSFLTNHVKDKEQANLIRKYANEKKQEDIPKIYRDILSSIIHAVSNKIKDTEDTLAAEMSAELNGIMKIYGGIFPKANDYHLLLSTDTWLGEQTAKLVETWLKNRDPAMDIYVLRQPDLQTEDMMAFQLALSDLVKKFHKDLPDYSRSGYKIIFNLTGGFKGVQGFLQSIANFYADETVYIFQSSSELMRIPRLPVKMDAVGVVADHLEFFRNLAMEIPGPVPKDIPETLMLSIDGETSLSPWGELLWVEARDQLYPKRIWPSPKPKKIKYGKAFLKSADGIEPDRCKQINERIDQLNRYLLDKKHNLKSLDFKQLAGSSMAPSTHEIDAWADSDARRIFLHKDGNGCYILDKLGKGLGH
ncbi:hypothetical protein DO021_09005 [Desulfobacter hydrogenophilus]|uniref:CRISPR system ring nuclease SSO1393-like domain-containing protein n=1 Tax=Desulfobacter hydrogenophilus TaxID=2291 RepID=A0A328FG43_9BACT|nr:hypothetical protein [Desulfobacter hydrogenophilus]NDY71653.1 hypothetical protein [Desulfobacter hydrogenophilus]QBH13167.1 hypothetical protein EYB58_09700 [Desulfobacter hydrogenophilus]RAM02412.1 hypothetical protein DO021_09005 [Desulfobacter hydrogenophilus]